MVVTLIGYRGTGKTTVAPLLAGRLNFESIDADTELERRVGRTVREIFESESESGFRARESALLAELLQRDRLVIAAGGGAVLDSNTRERMRAAGPVVWLRATVPTIVRQIAADPTTRDRRPNLTADGGRREIDSLLLLREPLYAETASVTVDVDDRTLDEIVAAILPSVLPPPIGSGGKWRSAGP
ncbi:MAG TPA: shikimate kinase [Planctomycetaceae bacterium]|jgi:shikimate kinase|nr:shikimate kinase [Planctomycetaceae bacterium]